MNVSAAAAVPNIDEVSRGILELAESPDVLAAMTYALLPLLVAAMLVYMYWHAAFRMRRARVQTARAMTRRRLRLPRRDARIH